MVTNGLDEGVCGLAGSGKVRGDDHDSDGWFAHVVDITIIAVVVLLRLGASFLQKISDQPLSGAFGLGDSLFRQAVLDRGGGGVRGNDACDVRLGLAVPDGKEAVVEASASAAPAGVAALAAAA